MYALKPASSAELEEDKSVFGLTELINTLSSCCYRPERNSRGNFVFAVDHCFCIRGHGTVMTGTVVSGSVAVNEVHIYVDVFLSVLCTK